MKYAEGTVSFVVLKTSGNGAHRHVQDLPSQVERHSPWKLSNHARHCTEQSVYVCPMRREGLLVDQACRMKAVKLRATAASQPPVQKAGGNTSYCNLKARNFTTKE